MQAHSVLREVLFLVLVNNLQIKGQLSPAFFFLFSCSFFLLPC